MNYKIRYISATYNIFISKLHNILKKDYLYAQYKLFLTIIKHIK